MQGPKEVLLNESSATHVRDGEHQAHHIQGLDLEHSELVKFKPHDVNYEGIVQTVLKEFVDGAQEMKRGHREEVERRKSLKVQCNTPLTKDI
jgi:hypothetical protein